MFLIVSTPVTVTVLCNLFLVLVSQGVCGSLLICALIMAGQEGADAMAQAMVQAFQNLRIQPAPTVRLARFSGTGEPLLKEWLEDIDIFCKQMAYEGEQKAGAIRDYLAGPARAEVECSDPATQQDPAKLLELLKKRFGKRETLQSLSSEFHSRVRQPHESLADFSRSLLQLRSRMQAVTAVGPEREAIKKLSETALLDQFAEGCRDKVVREEINRLRRDPAGLSFSQIRDSILDSYGDEDLTNLNKVRANEVNTAVAREECRHATDTTSTDPVVEHPLVKMLVQGQQALQGQLGELISQQSKILDQLAKKPQGNLSGFGRGNRGAQGGNSNRVPKVGPCWFCHSNDHIQRDCTKYKEQQEKFARVRQVSVMDQDADVASKSAENP